MTVSRTPEGYKNIGDAAELGDCYNVVASLGDLPPAVGGVRTLPAGTATLICGIISLPPNEKIVVPDDAILIGRDPDIDGILGDVNDALIDTAGNGLILKRLFIVNANTGPAAFGARTTTQPFPNERVTVLDFVSFFGGVRGLLVEDAFFVSISNVISRVEGDGITFRGTVDAVQVDSYTMNNPTAPAARGIVFETGLTISALRVNSSQFGLQQPGQVAVEAEAGSSLNLVGFFANAFLRLDPSAVPLVGLSPNGQPDVIFFADFGVAESKNGGNLSLNNPGVVPTVNPGVGTWARVGNGNPGTHPLYTLSPASARVLLDQPAGAESARLVYNGLEPVSAELFASLSLGPSAVVAALQVGARLVYLPAGGGSVPLTPEIFTPTSGVILSGTAISINASQIMNPGDAIALEVQNATDGTDLVVDTVNFGW